MKRRKREKVNDNLNIKHEKYLGDDRYMDDSFELKLKTSLSPWDDNDFIWEGDYNGDIIIVKLKRQTSEEDAEIIKPTELNINNQIISELKRVLRKLN